jgi:hypothetical protein
MYFFAHLTQRRLVQNMFLCSSLSWTPAAEPVMRLWSAFRILFTVFRCKSAAKIIVCFPSVLFPAIAGKIHFAFARFPFCALHAPSNRRGLAGVPFCNGNTFSTMRASSSSAFYTLAPIIFTSIFGFYFTSTTTRARQHNPLPCAFLLGLPITKQCPAFKVGHHSHPLSANHVLSAVSLSGLPLKASVQPMYCHHALYIL